MTECRSCRLVLPRDAYPRGDAVLPRWDDWCIECICDYQGWGYGLTTFVLEHAGAVA